MIFETATFECVFNLLGVGIIYISTERGRCTQQQMYIIFSFVFVSICLVEVLLFWVEVFLVEVLLFWVEVLLFWVEVLLFWVAVLLFVTMLGVGILSD